MAHNKDRFCWAVAMVKLINDCGLMGGLAPAGISCGNSMIRIFGMYHIAGGIYPGPRKKSNYMKTVVCAFGHWAYQVQRKKKKK
jgi:hypothetical protein